MESLNRFYHRKSQRRSSLHGQQAYELLINRYGMIDVLKYKGMLQMNDTGKPYAGKPHVRFDEGEGSSLLDALPFYSTGFSV
jgi:hypothetical protein